MSGFQVSLKYCHALKTSTDFQKVSAETEQQVLKIAHQLKETDVTAYRAGIWKPRTRPGNFEGVGSIGLKWLQKVKQETGLLITTEVANQNHVKLALDHDEFLIPHGSCFLWGAWLSLRSVLSDRRTGDRGSYPKFSQEVPLAFALYGASAYNRFGNGGAEQALWATRRASR